MRPALIAIASPGFDFPFRFGQRFEPMQIEALVAQRPVERLNMRVVCRRGGALRSPCGPCCGMPQVHHLAGKLGAIIAEQRFWRASETNEPVQNLDYILSAQTVSDLDRQTFAGVDINDRKRPDLLAVRKLIMYEVEAPGFVRRYRYYTTQPTEAGAAASAKRWRVPADALEGTVQNAIDDWLQSSDAAEAILGKGATADQQQNVRHQLDALIAADAGKGSPERLAAWAARIRRIDLDESSIAIELAMHRQLEDGADQKAPDTITIRSRMEIGPRGQGLRLLFGETQDEKQASEAMRALLTRAHYWRDQWFATPEKMLSEIANEAGADAGDVTRQMRLAFLAPDIVMEILEGKVPPTITAETLRRLHHLPASWAEQRRLLGCGQS